MGTPSCQVHIHLTTVPRQRMHMKTDPRLRQNKPMTEPHEKYCEAAVIARHCLFNILLILDLFQPDTKVILGPNIDVESTMMSSFDMSPKLGEYVSNLNI